VGDSWYKLPAEIARRRDLPAVAKLVAAVLLDQADGKPQVRIGVRRIAYLAGCHVETACRSVGELEQIGLVSRIAVVPGSGHRAVYDLHPEALGKPERSENPNSSARKIRTVALGKSEHVQTLVPDLYPEDAHVRAAKRRRTEPQVPGLQDLTRHFTDAWAARNGGQRYPHSGCKDGQAAKVVLGLVNGDLARATAIVDRFLDDPDPWLAGKHTIAILRSQLTRYLEVKGGNISGNGNGHRPDITSNDRYRHLAPAGS